MNYSVLAATEEHIGLIKKIWPDLIDTTDEHIKQILKTNTVLLAKRNEDDVIVGACECVFSNTIFNNGPRITLNALRTDNNNPEVIKGILGAVKSLMKQTGAQTCDIQTNGDSEFNSIVKNVATELGNNSYRLYNFSNLKR